jgi:nucleoid DNA-binding protein
MPARDPKKKMTKSQLMSDLADQTGLTKSQVEGVFDALQNTIKRELGGIGELTALPGLLKIRKVVKPARKARPGRNPATGEAITISAKPASKGVKVSTLKTLKEMV